MNSIALLSDIHGNIEALDAVLQDIARQPCDLILCAGDLVGYGPRPNEVIHRIKTENIRTVMGNYDEAVGFTLPACGCHIDNPVQKALSRHSLKWTIDHTSAESREFLRGLPESLSIPIGGKSILLTHASSDSISEYIYQEDQERIHQILSEIQEDVYVFGHTHYPFFLPVGSKWIANAGSVGRPKDGDNRASYMQLQVDDGSVRAEIVRVSYDVESVVQDMEKLGLDEAFRLFLQNGGEIA
jgi:putative phosphoesterase